MTYRIRMIMNRWYVCIYADNTVQNMTDLIGPFTNITDAETAGGETGYPDADKG